ncbi:hypothetical protein A1O3_08347 [Capronia epimyces CBS 606.96]|uniref:CAP-Gly domain-containing protein n=1 Tax=Capronia epimyces CBS 606.96 TaxID=1182542 RepID=W9XST9_9EURO|nr:uncharacterized protein A1O3_08347 [Capronia epimyces CBS 606.96]EXJ80061.1 hypothetical protein A1O3_08347 [Capronia epimyces CBS 606.96]
MSTSTPADIPVQIIVPNDANPNAVPLLAAERRITPSWTIAQLKAKLEPVTGIPAGAQSLRTRGLDGAWISLADEASIAGDTRYALRRGSEIEVLDARPPSARQTINFSDLSSVEKYQMPESQYEKLENSVLAWKRRQNLGRFDPNVQSLEAQAHNRREHDEMEVAVRGIKVGLRCRVGKADGRRGVVRFTGEIPGLGGAKEAGCVWVGVELDEPVGRNDGSVSVEIEDGSHQTSRVFQCRDKFGVFARPDKIEIGSFPPLDDLDEDMEEL